MKKLVLFSLPLLAMSLIAEPSNADMSGPGTNPIDLSSGSAVLPSYVTGCASSRDFVNYETDMDCSKNLRLRSEAIVQAAVAGEITAEEAAELLSQNAEALRKSN